MAYQEFALFRIASLAKESRENIFPLLYNLPFNRPKCEEACSNNEIGWKIWILFALAERLKIRHGVGVGEESVSPDDRQTQHTTSRS